MSDRTFKITSPHMTGRDVQMLEETLNAQMATWKVNYRVAEDGVYGVGDRSLLSDVLYGLGYERELIVAGVTPEVRRKIREKNKTDAEAAAFRARARFRRLLREQHADGGKVASPISKILQSSWGWHPGVHDGVDLMCNPKAALLAICHGVIVDVRSSGWWGLGARPSGGHAVSEGDGIIQLRSLTDVGPFEIGMVFGYGHAEGARVKVGELVHAGEVLGHAGFAGGGWHAHFMARGPMTHAETRAGRPKGIGSRDPMPFVTYARAHS